MELCHTQFHFKSTVLIVNGLGFLYGLRNESRWGITNSHWFQFRHV